MIEDKVFDEARFDSANNPSVSVQTNCDSSSEQTNYDSAHSRLSASEDDDDILDFVFERIESFVCTEPDERPPQQQVKDLLDNVFESMEEFVCKSAATSKSINESLGDTLEQLLEHIDHLACIAPSQGKKASGTERDLLDMVCERFEAFACSNSFAKFLLNKLLDRDILDKTFENAESVICLNGPDDGFSEPLTSPRVRSPTNSVELRNLLSVSESDEDAECISQPLFKISEEGSFSCSAEEPSLRSRGESGRRQRLAIRNGLVRRQSMRTMRANIHPNISQKDIIESVEKAIGTAGAQLGTILEHTEMDKYWNRLAQNSIALMNSATPDRSTTAPVPEVTSSTEESQLLPRIAGVKQEIVVETVTTEGTADQPDEIDALPSDITVGSKNSIPRSRSNGSPNDSAKTTDRILKTGRHSSSDSTGTGVTCDETSSEFSAEHDFRASSSDSEERMEMIVCLSIHDSDQSLRSCNSNLEPSTRPRHTSPRRFNRTLSLDGIPSENVVEWDGSDRASNRFNRSFSLDGDGGPQALSVSSDILSLEDSIEDIPYIQTSDTEIEAVVRSSFAANEQHATEEQQEEEEEQVLPDAPIYSTTEVETVPELKAETALVVSPVDLYSSIIEYAKGMGFCEENSYFKNSSLMALKVVMVLCYISVSFMSTVNGQMGAGLAQKKKKLREQILGRPSVVHTADADAGDVSRTDALTLLKQGIQL